MQSRTLHRQENQLLTAAVAAVASVGLAGVGTSQVRGDLFIDIRALSATGVGNTISPDGKSVIPGAADGRTITLGVYARISGTNSAQQVIDINGNGSELVTVNDDTLKLVSGAFTSGTGALKGNMGAAVAGPNTVYNPTFTPFNGPGSTNGVFSDFDSDGDLDLGAIGTEASEWWACRAAVGPTLGAQSSASGKGYSTRPFNNFTPNANDSLIDATTSEVRIGTLRFMPTGGTGIASIEFIPIQTIPNGQSAAQWFEDGVDTGKSPLDATLTFGAPVIIGSIPEPTATGLLGVASLGLLSRRQSRLRTAGHLK